MTFKGTQFSIKHGLFLNIAGLQMNKDIAIKLGRNIARARKATGKTQAEIAEKADIDNVSLSRIERGIVTPSILTLNRIAKALEEPIGRLFDGATSQVISISNSIAVLLAKLPDEDRLFLLHQMQLWSDKLIKKNAHTFQDK